MGRVRGSVLGAVVLSVLTAVSAVAQAPSQLTRFTISVAPALSQPKAEFARNVGNGLGVGGGLLYNLDRPGILSLRFDASWLEYGREKRRVPLSPTLGGRILVDEATTNWISTFSVGPELALPEGAVRPYLNAAFSGLLFRTTTSLKATRSYEHEIASTTNYSDLTRAWVLGTGVRIPVPWARSRISLDLGIRYHRGGLASYLREGSIQDAPDGSISITPLTSRTPYMGYVIGIRYRIPFNPYARCPRFVC